MNNVVGVITPTALFIQPHNELANFDSDMTHTWRHVSKLPQMNNAVGVITPTALFIRGNFDTDIASFQCKIR